jgi:hypothetical protein
MIQEVLILYNSGFQAVVVVPWGKIWQKEQSPAEEKILLKSR